MRTWGLFVLTGLGWAGAAFGGEGPLSFVAQVETGFVSNATDSPIGSGDLFITHSESVVLAGEGDGNALRGSLAFSETRFWTQDFENDRGVAGELVFGRQVTPEWLVTGQLRGTVDWVGDDINIGGLYLATETEQRAIGGGVEAVHSAGWGEVRLGLEAASRSYGDTHFQIEGLVPVRLSAAVDDWTASASGRLALAGGALTWSVAQTGVQVAEADQLTYGRLPFDLLRIKVGAELPLGPGFTLAGRFGADRVNGAGVEVTEPYWRAGLQASPMAGLVLAFEAGQGLEVVDPLDGLASRTQEIEASAALAIDPRATLTARWQTRVEDGVFTTATRRTVIASLGLDYLLGEGQKIGVSVSALEHAEPGNTYSTARFSVALGLSL